MTLELGAILGLLALGGWVAADSTSVGQFMVSRPFVAAALAGWIAGDPAGGMVIGVILEAFHLVVLPVGAARYPEGGPPGVVSGALFAVAPPLPSTLLICVVFALAWEWVAGESVRVMRQMNVRLVVQVSEEHPVPLQSRHLMAMLLDAIRGVVLVAAGLPLLALLLGLSMMEWRVDERIATLAVGAALVGLLASCLRFFPGRTRYFLVGAGTGLLFLWWGP